MKSPCSSRWRFSLKPRLYHDSDIQKTTPPRNFIENSKSSKCLKLEREGGLVTPATSLSTFLFRWPVALDALQKCHLSTSVGANTLIKRGDFSENQLWSRLESPILRHTNRFQHLSTIHKTYSRQPSNCQNDVTKLSDRTKPQAEPPRFIGQGKNLGMPTAVTKRRNYFF